MRNIDEIIQRMMQATKSRDLTALSRYLRVDVAALSNWKRRLKVPYEYIHEIVEKEGVSFDWILGIEATVVREHADPYIASTVRNMEALDMEGKKDVSVVSEKTKRLQDLLKEKERGKAA